MTADPAVPVRLSIVVAADESDVIGADGRLPWHLPEDLRRFRALTTGHVVVAGRITHESIVERLGRPLPDRTTVVVTRTPAAHSDQPGVVEYVSDVDTALRRAAELARAAGQDEVFVIGGAEIYHQVLPRVTRVHLTRVAGAFDGDRALPDGWLSGFSLTAEDDAPAGCRFLTYGRI